MTTRTPRDTAGEATPRAPRRLRRIGGKARRRIAGLLALGLALLAAGGLYALFAPEPQTAQAGGKQSALERKGAQIYNNTCITCHGSNLDGVDGRGPSLIGIGEAAVYFQTSTGRMPMARQEAQAPRKPPKLSPAKIDAVSAYIGQHGGPERPAEKGEALRGSDSARGGELFRLNCASCHNFTGQGGALSSGKFAPPLAPASEEQIYTAMLTGPQNMPKFSERQLTPEEKKDIIAFVKAVSDGNNNPGGSSLGGWGPASEGVVMWVVGMAALVGVALWMGSRAGDKA